MRTVAAGHGAIFRTLLQSGCLLTKMGSVQKQNPTAEAELTSRQDYGAATVLYTEKIETAR
jgi:hypothetical protein